MSEETNKPKKSGSSKTCLIIAIVVIISLGLLAGVYFGLAYVLRKSDSTTGVSTDANNKTKTTGKFTDQNLVGSWQSECLVPDPESKWAEQHSFVIKKDGTATHTRKDWGMNDCTTLEPTGTIVDTFKLTIPSVNKINLNYVSSDNSRMTGAQASQFSGQIIYDIYQVSGNTLEFGHGFRGDDLAYGDRSGGSEGDRFDTLNTFIVYTKK